MIIICKIIDTIDILKPYSLRRKNVSKTFSFVFNSRDRHGKTLNPWIFLTKLVIWLCQVSGICIMLSVEISCYKTAIIDSLSL